MSDTCAVPKPLIGRALLALDAAPRLDLSRNQEYAPPGTTAWVARAKALLDDLVEQASPAVSSHESEET